MEHGDFRLWWIGLLTMELSLQMLEVAIGWQVYGLHRSALQLGLIGLAEFIPMLVFALPAGHLADRLPRRTVFAGALGLGVVAGAGLAAISAAGVRSVGPFYVFAFAAGTAQAFGAPASRAMAPTLVPGEALASAMNLRSAAFQVGMVAGPALGGVIYGLSPVVVYALSGAVSLAAAALVMGMRPQPAAHTTSGEDAPTLTDTLGGLHFVRRTPILLGAILLDLLAVLFGGAVALLPLFARSILHVGPTGVGVLRAAPAVGALIAAALITRRPLGGRAGRTLLTVVALFGASMVVFGLSRTFLLSLGALAVSGFVDFYSMNIRSTTVALATPDPLRGRVNAVEAVFVSASNQLGAFESGLAAALVGAVPAVVAGGAITVVLALAWGRMFPDLAGVDRLETLEPAPASAVA